MLNINQHEEYGKMFSGQTEFVLKQVYSSDIKIQSIDVQQYTCYAFAVRECTTPDNGELLCDKCNAIRKYLRRRCCNWYHLDNKGLPKNTNSSTICFASPTKEKEKMGMAAELLQKYQELTWYLKSRLEEQRENRRSGC